jgi:hypothetical protein
VTRWGWGLRGCGLRISPRRACPSRTVRSCPRFINIASTEYRLGSGGGGEEAALARDTLRLFKASLVDDTQAELTLRARVLAKPDGPQRLRQVRCCRFPSDLGYC